jgi:hypothetical protein
MTTIPAAATIAIEVRLVSFASSGLRGGRLGCEGVRIPLDGDAAMMEGLTPLPVGADGMTEVGTAGLVSMGVRRSGYATERESASGLRSTADTNNIT